MAFEKQPPHLDPHIGCLLCGGGEMVGGEKIGKITAALGTRLYNSFGGWTITRDGEHYFSEESDVEFEDCRSLQEIEDETAADPDHDWRAEVYLAMREAVYQRQGKNEWVLISSGPGFA